MPTGYTILQVASLS